MSRECFEEHWRRGVSLVNSQSFFPPIHSLTRAEISTSTSLYLLWKYKRGERTQLGRSWVRNITRRRTQLLAVI